MSKINFEGTYHPNFSSQFLIPNLLVWYFWPYVVLYITPLTPHFVPLSMYTSPPAAKTTLLASTHACYFISLTPWGPFDTHPKSWILCILTYEHNAMVSASSHVLPLSVQVYKLTVNSVFWPRESSYKTGFLKSWTLCIILITCQMSSSCC